MDWRVEHYDAVTTTQDVIKEKADFGEKEGLVVQAKIQTKGRGRHNRKWVSEAGNLHLSILLKPQKSLQDMGQLSLLVAVALAETLSPYTKKSSPLKLKWPNDIVIGKKKCAGILVECEANQSGDVDYVCVGIGVNIENAPKHIGTSLHKISKTTPSLEDVRDNFLEHLDDLYDHWHKRGFDYIKQQWLRFGPDIDSVIFVYKNDEEQRGKFKGLDDSGVMLLEDENKEILRITAGDIYM